MTSRTTAISGAPAIDESAPATSWAKDSPLPERASLGQSIANSLREAIVSGAIVPGQQLKQDALSLDYRVSPAPVREALRQLESEGLVEHFPNRGVFVTNVPEEEALKLLFPVRLLIEDYALQHTMTRLDAELVAQLEAQIAIMQEGADTHDVGMITAADVRFHQLAVEASGSRHSAQLWHSILPRIRLQFARLTPRQKDLHHVAEEHEELLEALRLGDPAGLSSVLQEHITGISIRLMGQEAPSD
jgi:DNA-binding GntR family transcriptional regulator